MNITDAIKLGSQTREVSVWDRQCFFRHMYLTQPSVTPIDAVLHASTDVCQILKGVPPAKGDTRTDVNMLMEIFRDVGAKGKTEVDKQRSRVRAATEAHIKSNQAKETGI